MNKVKIEEVGPGAFAVRKEPVVGVVVPADRSEFKEWEQLQLDLDLKSLGNLEVKPLTLPPEVMVEQPPHYTYSAVETIEAIEAWELGYHLGNVVKYVSRAGKKDPAKKLEDLRKARWYLDRFIELTEAGEE